MRQAILDANNTVGDFKIIIAVDGTLITTSALPQLQVFGRSGEIQSKPGVTITGFSCAIQGDGNLTLEHVFIDDSAYGFPTITVLENATLLFPKQSYHRECIRI
jgi:spermidine synthase